MLRPLMRALVFVPSPPPHPLPGQMCCRHPWIGSTAAYCARARGSSRPPAGGRGHTARPSVQRRSGAGSTVAVAIPRWPPLAVTDRQSCAPRLRSGRPPLRAAPSRNPSRAAPTRHRAHPSVHPGRASDPIPGPVAALPGLKASVPYRLPFPDWPLARRPGQDDSGQGKRSSCKFLGAASMVRTRAAKSR
jgi:hypothetical protein